MMHKYMSTQRKKIEIDKWCEGSRINQGPGQAYVLDWIFINAAWFRQAWESSLCKDCSQSGNCGHLVLQECNEFQKEK